MINKPTRSLLLAGSLFLLSTSFQSALAAETSSAVPSQIEKVTITETGKMSSTAEKAKASAANEKMKASSAADKAKMSAANEKMKVNNAADKAKMSTASEKAKVSMAKDKLSKININSASVEQLTTLNGIGDKTAQAIVDYRKKNGDFTNLKDLVNVKGIGVATLKKVIPYVSL